MGRIWLSVIVGSIALCIAPARAGDVFGRYDGVLTYKMVYRLENVMVRDSGTFAGTFAFDTTTEPILTIEEAPPDAFLEVYFKPSKSRKKAGFVSDPKDAGQADMLHDAIVNLPRKKKKRPTVDPQPGDVTSATPSGKMKSKQTGNRLKGKLKYKVEGKIVGGTYDGGDFLGKIILKFDGDRDFGL